MGCLKANKQKKNKQENPHTNPERKAKRRNKCLCHQGIKNKNTKCAIFKLTLIGSTKR